jgi:hypothetical protein
MPLEQEIGTFLGRTNCTWELQLSGPCLLHGHTVATVQKHLGLQPSNAGRIVSRVAETAKKGTAQETRSEPDPA